MDQLLAPPSKMAPQAHGVEACASEPIRIPAAVQPCGALLILDRATLTLRSASANARELFDADTAPGARLGDILGHDAAAQVHAALHGDRLSVGADWVGESPHELGGGWHLRLVVQPRTVLLEVEALSHEPKAKSALLHSMDTLTEHATAGGHWQSLASLAADRLRGALNLDRVMVYRFDADWNGEVVAEARRDDIEPYLGLHFPAGDIPPQARELYREQWVRYIGDVHYRPQPLVPPLLGDGEAIDLSRCDLRSVSPVHIEYLRNMGVRATLVMSVLVRGTLWGLVACHHLRPLGISAQVRHGVGTWARVLSLAMTQVLDQERRQTLGAADQQAGTLTALIVSSQLEPPDWLEVTSRHGHDMAAAPDADGVLLWDRTRVRTLGRSLSATAASQLRERAAAQVQSTPLPWVSDTLDEIDGTQPPWGIPCGVVALRLSAGAERGVLWWRGEHVHEVHWAGDPAKGIEIVDGRPRPRRSFARWLQTVHGHCRAWQPLEIAVASRWALQLAGATATVDQRTYGEMVGSLSTLIDEAHELVVTLDPSGRVLQANRSATRAAGLGADEIIGRHIAELLPPRHRERLCSRFARFVHEGCPAVSVLLRLQAPDGRQPVLRVSLTVDREQPHVLLVGRDISEEREKARSLLLLHRQLDRIVEVRTLELRDTVQQLNAYARTVAHDLKTPLNAVAGFVQLALVKAGEGIPADAQLMLRRALDGSVQMSELIDDLLNHARAGAQALVHEDVDVGALVSEAAAQEGGLYPVVHLNTAVAGHLITDRSLLRQLLCNLIGNAMKYSSRSSAPRVEVRGSVTNRVLTLEVDDNGIGLGDVDGERAFGLFERLPGARAFPGSGVGLATCRSIVERQGGSIRLGNRPGGGARIALTLPGR